MCTASGQEGQNLTYEFYFWGVKPELYVLSLGHNGQPVCRGASHFVVMVISFQPALPLSSVSAIDGMPLDHAIAERLKRSVDKVKQH
jgi:hypothetical protein